jgi:2-amino-4-hydroxy-6-hydroxymethyldihydropteridine diphosphokinase
MDSSPRELDQWAYVALGSNLGDSISTLRQAIERLEHLSTQPIRVSSLWQTGPVDCPPGSPNFINAIAGLKPQPGETPESLLQKLQTLQKQFGRKQKTAMNEPRPLDLDLITFGRERRNSPELVLPHPRAHQRRFVLQPLSEVAPELILPGESRTVAELLAGLPADPGVVKL